MIYKDKIFESYTKIILYFIFATFAYFARKKISRKGAKEAKNAK